MNVEKRKENQNEHDTDMSALRGRIDANIHDRGHTTTKLLLPPVRVLDFKIKNDLVREGRIVRNFQ